MRTTGISYLLWCLCLVGFNGIHRMYNGKWITGLIWFFTLGLLYIGQIIDLFLIPSMTDEANYEERMRQERVERRVAADTRY